MRLLAIESTCDETGIAVLEGPRPPASGVPRVVASVVASQTDLHERFGGVVPEIAARAHLRQLLPLLDACLAQAGCGWDSIEAVAVATKPGLVGALVVGLTAAKTIAFARDIPLIAVDHLEGHLYACQMAYPDRDVYPCVGCIVSGGHTSLFDCRGPLDNIRIGSTVDDAAGEAFDKVATLLGLGYPGGPLVEQCARTGNPRAFAFPRAFYRDARLDFSFSGLKTAVLYALRGQDGRPQNIHTTTNTPPATPDPQRIADLAASFQEAVVDVLVEKCRQALRHTGYARLSIGGGVAANTVFRDRLAELAQRTGVSLFIPPLWLCTDNAAMAGVAFCKLAAGETANLDIDVVAGLVRPGRTQDKTS